MSVLFRARVASFMTGVAVTSVHAIYQLKKELVQSQDVLINQVRGNTGSLTRAYELNLNQFLNWYNFGGGVYFSPLLSFIPIFVLTFVFLMRFAGK